MIRVEDWALTEDEVGSLPHARTLFTLANGFLGVRGALEEDQDLADQAFVNGFYETWPIEYPEDAYGLARVGQTIQPIGFPGTYRLDVNGTVLDPRQARISGYLRRLDFRTGLVTRQFTWTTPDEVEVRVWSRRLVSFVQREVVATSYQIQVSQDCNIQLSSAQVLPGAPQRPEVFDPRRSTRLDGCVQTEQVLVDPHLRITLRTKAASLSCAMVHRVSCEAPYDLLAEPGEGELSKTFRAHLGAGQSATMTAVAIIGADPDQVDPLVSRISGQSWESLESDQADYLARWWQAADVVVGCPGDTQGRIRWNLFQTLQASARADGAGIAAKGVSGSGYDGHYFWDVEAMVLPCLTYTRPDLARQGLSYRYSILDQARQRAGELALPGAAFAWRTIDGREASAVFEVGTAQHHINADIAYAVNRYLAATADLDFLSSQGIDLLVETARLWMGLGFHGSDNRFHIHGVTGPDEYTAMVDDNLYTNVMAAANLLAADHWLDVLAEGDASAGHAALVRLGVTSEERQCWRQAADAMAIPFDQRLGIHGQDSSFLGHPVWDFANTPEQMYPLLLHYHPLTLYRHQVIKQADLVLALITRPDLFTPEQKRADFDYYDAITTGDSTLSVTAQAIMAAEVGHLDLAETYFRSALDIDLEDTHANADDGVHVANAAMVWSALVMGFAGLRDYGQLTLNPRLPQGWDHLKFTLTIRGSQVRVTVTPDATSLELAASSTGPVDLTVYDHPIQLTTDSPSRTLLSQR